MGKQSKDTLTLDIFRDYEPPEIAPAFPEDVVKGYSIDIQICRAVSEAMQRCDLKRSEIAARMTDFLGGQNVTANMLDTYASPARTDHKITLERFIALIAVTDCFELLGFVCGFAGYVAVPQKYNEVIQLWLAEEKIAELENRRAALRGKVKGYSR